MVNPICQRQIVKIQKQRCSGSILLQISLIIDSEHGMDEELYVQIIRTGVRICVAGVEVYSMVFICRCVICSRL